MSSTELLGLVDEGDEALFFAFKLAFDSYWIAVSRVGLEIDVECIISMFAKYGCKLPTEESLNDDLLEFGMYGTLG